MTRESTITIHCDGWACHASMTVSTPQEAERALTWDGWATTEDGDYCPKCKEKYTEEEDEE